MRISFVERNFSASSLDLIDSANSIIEEYQAAGYTLTLRQLYYQFVSRDLIRNKQSEYKRLGSVINDARLAGLIDWDAIEDRGRNVIFSSAWESPASMIRSCADQFQIDPWDDQEYRVEVWIEKEALIGVITDICDKFRVPHFACKGYVSQSEMFDAGYDRIQRYISSNQEPIILHFGDHDPSGIDMTRDIADRLTMFAQEEVQVIRLALNWEQVQKYNPPPNPAKVTDSRFSSYEKEFGDESWELDALEPRILNRLIEGEIKKYLNPEKWGEAMKRESESKAHLKFVSDNFANIVKKYRGKR